MQRFSSLIRNLSSTAWVIGLVLLSACGKKEPPAASYPQAELVAADLENFRSIRPDGYAIYDLEKRGRFTSIFGGTDQADVLRFLDTRARYFLDPTDFSHRIESAFSSYGAGSATRIFASNIGLGYWIHSVLDQRQMAFNIGGRSVPIESSRVGVVLLGEAYEEYLHDDQGNEVRSWEGERILLPPAYRQSILLHEARHSDCTGGLTRTKIAQLRAFPESERDEQMLGMQCGHQHALCPKDHMLAGTAACDAESWGAYTVSAEFLRAISHDSSMRTGSSVSYQIAVAFAIDSESRVIVDRAGKPNLSSSGVLDQAE